MDRIPTTKVPSIGVGRSGNVFKLFYNPDFTGKLNIDTTIQLLKHEMLHVAFNHFTIWDGAERHDPSDIKVLRNIAADLEINGYLDRSKIQKEVPSPVNVNTKG